MGTQIGRAKVQGMVGATLAISALAGYISPNLQSLRANHNASTDASPDQAGDTATLYFTDEILECTFDFIPEGTTTAQAKISAGLPPAGSGVVITGLPIIQMGPFADALNVGGGGLGSNPWVYEGGGSLSGEAKGRWTATLPLKRYPKITTATPPA